MIYLDNAATTWPKPPSVIAAVNQGMRRLGTNPGRGGYEMSLKSSNAIYACRKTAAELFGAPGPECVVFTQNCTHAVNIVLKGMLKPGDHVVVSSLEHNAVMRPLNALREKGVAYNVATIYPGNEEATVHSFAMAMNMKTKLVACIHASNVFGTLLPIEAIGAMAKCRGAAFLVDAAQSAGLVPIDMKTCGIDFLCMPGHKGLYGPMSTGMLLTPYGDALDTLIEGGTGSSSLAMEQPDYMPERHESGTLNTTAIFGLKAGMDFVRAKGIQRIYQHELRLMCRLYDRLCQIDGVLLYTPRPQAGQCVPVLSFNLEGFDSTQAASILGKKGVAVRAGYHCAPAAHQAYGTLQTGTVRAAPSAFTQPREIDEFAEIVGQVMKNKGSTMQNAAGMIK